jgi:hypothetical protein
MSIYIPANECPSQLPFHVDTPLAYFMRLPCINMATPSSPATQSAVCEAIREGQPPIRLVRSNFDSVVRIVTGNTRPVMLGAVASVRQPVRLVGNITQM